MTSPARGRPAAALVVVLLGVAVWVVGFTGVLGVERITVTGLRALSAEQVRAAAAVPDRQPLARVDLGAVEQRVRGLAGVERVAVARSWPGTLRITVTERQGVAVVERGGGVFLVDPGGYVFQRVATRPRGVPRLTIDGVGPDDPATRSALAALTALPARVVAQIAKIAAPSPESVTLFLSGGRTVLWGGGADSAAKAAALTALLRKPAGVYDVSTPSVVTTR